MDIIMIFQYLILVNLTDVIKSLQEEKNAVLFRMTLTIDL